jgi:hypothetical protein
MDACQGAIVDFTSFDVALLIIREPPCNGGAKMSLPSLAA